MRACRFSAMEQVGAPESLKPRLQDSFFGTAGCMRNKED